MKKKVAIAVDLGGTNVRVALVDQRGKILRKVVAKTNKKGKSGFVVSKQIIELVKTVDDGRHRIAGIGISAAGPLDIRKGELSEPTNLPYTRVPIVTPLKKAFRKPVVFLNDANAAVLGEKKYGQGKSLENLVYLTISTGIGAGVIVDGHLLSGRNGNAAEVSYFSILVDEKFLHANKEFQRWGKYASGSSLPRVFSKWSSQKRHQVKTSKEVFDLARGGDERARQFLEEVCKIHARGIAGIIAAYDPELITLGGGVMFGDGDYLFPKIKRHLKKFPLPSPPLKMTKLGDEISLLGAAAAVFEKKR